MKGVRHLGYVDKVEKNSYFIKIISKSACANCHANNACPASDLKEKFLTFPVNQCRELSVGEQVEIEISNRNGEQAYIIAYTIPVFIIVVAVIALKLMEISQGVSAIIIIAVIMLYFVGLYMLKDKLAAKIKIKII